MSQIEQIYHGFINRHPEIRSCLAKNLINVRALARTFLKEENQKANIEAVVAMIRRAHIEKLDAYTDKEIFSDTAISTKDEISILDYEKEIVSKLKDININFNKNETLKIVVGSKSVKVFIDSSNSSHIKQILGKNLIKEHKSISEISLSFPTKASNVKGIIAFVTTQLLLSGINIKELLTCTPEMLIYVDDDQSLKAYEVLKSLKR